MKMHHKTYSNGEEWISKDGISWEMIKGANTA